MSYSKTAIFCLIDDCTKKRISKITEKLQDIVELFFNQPSLILFIGNRKYKKYIRRWATDWLGCKFEDQELPTNSPRSSFWSRLSPRNQNSKDLILESKQKPKLSRSEKSLRASHPRKKRFSSIDLISDEISPRTLLTPRKFFNKSPRSSDESSETELTPTDFIDIIYSRCDSVIIFTDNPDSSDLYKIFILKGLGCIMISI